VIKAVSNRYAVIVSSCWERRSQSVLKVISTVGTAFKPPLGELYKKSTLFAPQLAYLRSKIDFFSGEGAQPLP